MHLRSSQPPILICIEVDHNYANRTGQPSAQSGGTSVKQMGLGCISDRLRDCSWPIFSDPQKMYLSSDYWTGKLMYHLHWPHRRLPPQRRSKRYRHHTWFWGFQSFWCHIYSLIVWKSVLCWYYDIVLFHCVVLHSVFKFLINMALNSDLELLTVWVMQLVYEESWSWTKSNIKQIHFKLKWLQ